MALAVRTPSYVPTRDEIVEAARALVPALRARAQQAEELRQPPDETLADLRAENELHGHEVP